MSQVTGNRAAGRSLAEIVGIAFGVIYLLVGLLGFTITGDVEFAGTDGEKLLGLFEVNPLHNIVHLAIGAALLVAGLKGEATARAINTVVGATYLLVAVLGLFIAGDDKDANILALNGTDNLLHFASAAVLLTAGLMGRGRTTTTTSAGTSVR